MYKDLLALHNVGNSCYLNCAIHCILSCKEFRNALEYYSKHGENNMGIIYILNEFSKKRSSDTTPLANPLIIKQILSRQNSFFGDFYQQDCHECLVNIIDIIHKENAKEKIKYVPTINYFQDTSINALKNIAEKNWKKYIEIFGNSFVMDICTGQLRSSLICHHCKKERNSFEIINNISLSLSHKDNIDIIECFENYFKSEHLDDKVQCDNCKVKTETSKTLSIWKFPKILILHLKRYKQLPNGNYLRNNCIVDFSPILTFSNHFSCKKIQYQLQCVVNHYGTHPMGGHYTCITRKDSEWVQIDDSSIYKHEENALVSSASYILIYTQI